MTKRWIQKIMFIQDLLDDQGNIATMEFLENKYNITF